MAEPKMMLSVVRYEGETRVLCHGCFLECLERAKTFHDAMARLPCKPELMEHSLDNEDGANG